MNTVINSYREQIRQCFLFKNIPEAHLEQALISLNAYVIKLKKDEIIIHYDDPIRYAYLILKGQVEGSFDTENFNKISMNRFHEGELFAESLSVMQLAHSPVEATAIKDTTLLVLDINHLFAAQPCCDCELIILQNLMQAMAYQNHLLTTKVRILSQKSLRDRIMVYLTTAHPADHKVILPYSRSAWAEYLGVNRSAMERELSKMIDEGLISIDDKTITIH